MKCNINFWRICVQIWHGQHCNYNVFWPASLLSTATDRWGWDGRRRQRHSLTFTILAPSANVLAFVSPFPFSFPSPLSHRSSWTRRHSLRSPLWFGSGWVDCVVVGLGHPIGPSQILRFCSLSFTWSPPSRWSGVQLLVLGIRLWFCENRISQILRYIVEYTFSSCVPWCFSILLVIVSIFWGTFELLQSCFWIRESGHFFGLAKVQLLRQIEHLSRV